LARQVSFFPYSRLISAPAVAADFACATTEETATCHLNPPTPTKRYIGRWRARAHLTPFSQRPAVRLPVIVRIFRPSLHTHTHTHTRAPIARERRAVRRLHARQRLRVYFIRWGKAHVSKTTRENNKLRAVRPIVVFTTATASAATNSRPVPAFTRVAHVHLLIRRPNTAARCVVAPVAVDGTPPPPSSSPRYCCALPSPVSRHNISTVGARYRFERYTGPRFVTIILLLSSDTNVPRVRVYKQRSWAGK